MGKHRSSKVHRAIANVHHAATMVVGHHDHIDEPLWRRLFDAPREPHLIDSTRHFVAALDDVLVTPMAELSHEDVEAAQKEVDRVVDRLEKRISALSDPKEAMPFATAIYVLRARFEEITVQRAHQRVPRKPIASSVGSRTGSARDQIRRRPRGLGR
jgi:hypothetical protein